MQADLQTVRLLGAAQLVVFICSMLSERLLTSVVGTGTPSERLIAVSHNLTRLRISNLTALINCLAIVVLGALFYAVFYKEYKVIALIAMACFFGEAITLAVSKLGTYGLISLSQEFVAAGAPEPSAYQTLGDFLYYDIDRRGYDIHMLFFCIGGILWYLLLYISKAIPAGLSLWGLIAICLLTLPVLTVLYDRKLTGLMILGLPYAPFEVVLGLWLVIKGFH